MMAPAMEADPVVRIYKRVTLGAIVTGWLFVAWLFLR